MKFGLSWWWRLLTHNLAWKMLSIFIGIGIWAFVAGEPELATSVPVLMQYDGLPDYLEISGIEPASNTVTLEVTGPSGALRGLGEPGGPRVAVVLDMKHAGPGAMTYTIGNGNLRLAKGLRLVRAAPSEARIVLERRESRVIPVVARFQGDGAAGFRLASYEISPRNLEITGAASHVHGTSEAVTDPVDLSRAESGQEFSVNAYVSDPYVRFRTDPRVTITVTMTKK